MIRLAILLQAPTVSIYQLVKTKTFTLYLFDMVKWIKWKKKWKNKIINYEEKESYKDQEKCHICKEKFCVDKDDENYTNRKKTKDHCHYTGKLRGAAHNKCNLNYKVPKDIPIIFHNASYDTSFIINQLAEEFKGELNCIGETMEKHITFSVSINKEVIDNNDEKKTITYKLKFIDSFEIYVNFIIRTCW